MARSFPHGVATVPVTGERFRMLAGCVNGRANKNARPLLPQAELANHRFIAFGIVFLEVVEQATPLADQHEKTAARTVVFLVRFEVLRQLANSLA